MEWKYVEDCETEKCSLEIYECSICGYHIGVDLSFMEQVNSTPLVTCPACKEKTNITYKGD
jgi:DNA-directed RNA polymerase subunit RPC12/RpoP